MYHITTLSPVNHVRVMLARQAGGNLIWRTPERMQRSAPCVVRDMDGAMDLLEAWCMRGDSRGMVVGTDMHTGARVVLPAGAWLNDETALEKVF